MPECPTPIDRNGDQSALDYAAAIQTKTDAKLRVWGFVFSVVLLTCLVAAHVLFEWHGRHLPTPDIVWVVVLAPWLGASLAKLLRLLKR